MQKKISIHLLRNWIFCLLVLTLLVCGGQSIYAESTSENTDPNNYETWLQTIYSREEGLSVGTANAIATTSDGIIWVGTYAGLYRYNGSKFQLMNQFDSVKSVECLYVDDQDRLWVGTNDNGISVFQNEKLMGKISVKNGLPSDAVRSIVQASDGNYYIGTSDSMAVVRFTEKPEILTTIDEVEYADKSTADSNGNVVTISSYGAMYLIRDKQVIYTLKPGSSDGFSSCVFDVSGRIYVGTSLGNVHIYEIEDQQFHEVSQMTCSGIRKINNLIRVNKSTIFVCADNGIGYFDSKNHFHSLKTPNFNSNIYNVIFDYQGNLWFSSSRMGLLRLCKTSFIELFTEFSIEPAVVNSVERYKDMLYAGTDSGLVIIDEIQQKQVFNELTSQFDNIRIRQILKDSRDNLWFCTYGEGLMKYDGSSLKYIDRDRTQIGTRVRTILELANGELVVTSENGVTFLNDEEILRTLTQKNGLLNQINLCLLEKPDKTLLIGSDGSGIAKFKDDQIQIIGTDQGLPSGVILRMEEDKAGDGIFVVTSNSLCYLNPDDTIRELKNFPYSNNYSILQQGDTVFVLGSSGIYAILRDELLSDSENMNYTYLDTRAGLHDALVANSWLLHEADEEKAYLATSSGVTLFDLAAYDDRPSDFFIRIASITIDGEDSTMNNLDSFSFSRTIRRLEINPEIINYSTVDPIISCYLEGFDKEAIIMPQSELSPIVYTNLPAGKYTFKIELVDSESGVHISSKVYYLEKETSFTDTIWFYVLLVGGIFLLATWIGIFAARRLYTIKMNEKENELKKTWKLSMTDSLTGLYNRFAMRTHFPGYIGQNITVTMMDVDYFKRFNDTYGHEMGDNILKSISMVISKYYTEPDVAYRFGGDEFLLWDTDKTKEEIEEKLQKMTEEIQKLPIEGCNELIHVSYGYASGTPKTEEELRGLRNLADQKLYEAKKRR